jgi:uracil-DNA glycosylase
MVCAVTMLVQLRRHVTRLQACTACPKMIGPVVTGVPVISPVMLIGQAPGDKEGHAGKPFAWTAGKTLFQWFATIGMTEEQFRERVYMAAVARCFPGKAEAGGDRVPDADEIERCTKHLAAEAKMIQPRLVIPVGKLAITQLLPPAPPPPPTKPGGRKRAAKPTIDKLVEVIGDVRRVTYAGVEMDMIALPHPSGASTWHRTEPGKTLLSRALALIAQHEAWRSIIDAPAARLDASTSAPM